VKLSVIIVNYNVRYYLEQCLISLQKALQGIDAEVIVVDNHSRDDSVAYLSARFEQVRFIKRNHNLGFSRANNVGIRQSQGEYVLLLNPDTVVGESTLRDSLAFMDEHQQAGGLGVRMIHPNGRDAMESRRGVPTPMTAFLKMCGNGKRYYMTHLSWDKPERINIISGAFLMLRRAAIDKVGLLDEDFFMYGEDIDLSFRLLKGGFENWYLPSRILHYKGESTQKTSFRYVHVFYDAMLIFFRKHYGHLSFLLSFPIKTAIYGKAFFALLSAQVERMRKGLGFVIRQNHQDLDFVIKGSPEAVSDCWDILNRNGYHPVCELQKGYVIYDTSTYSYDEIFRMHTMEQADEKYIALYNRDTHMIITGEEVML